MPKLEPSHIVLVIAFVAFLLYLTFPASRADILSGCFNITQPGIYYLNGDVSNDSTCFIINASDVIFDCLGFSIDGSLNPGTYGIFANSSAGNEYTNITIKNCNISNWDRGIYFLNVNNSLTSNSTTYNNTYGIYLWGGFGNNITCNTANLNFNDGIYLYSDSNNITCNTANLNGNDGIKVSWSYGNTLSNNTANSNMGDGIELESNSDSNAVINNTVNYNSYYGIRLSSNSDSNAVINNTVNSNNADGIFLNLNSGNNIISNTLHSNIQNAIIFFSSVDNSIVSNNDIWNCTYGSTNACIEISSSDYNVFDSNRINKSSYYGIHIISTGSSDSNHNVFKDTNMTNIGYTSVYLDSSGNSHNLNNTFLNFSYENETVGFNSTLIRKWHYRAYVNDTDGENVSGAEVSAYNSSGVLIESLTTGSDGWTGTGSLIDYVNGNMTKYYYSDYTVYANKSGYDNGSKTHNVTILHNIMSDNFELSGGGSSPGEIDNCTGIGSPGVYLLNASINNWNSGTCFTINISDVILDCQSHLIDGVDTTSTYGILTKNETPGYLTNVTIKDCVIRDWENGIKFDGVNESNISNISTYDNTLHGIYLYDSSGNNLTNITAYGNTDVGVRLYGSSYNNLTNITAWNNDVGIQLEDFSDRNTISEVNCSYATNGYNGLEIKQSSYNHVKNSEFNWNTGVGIYILTSSSNNNLTNLTVFENTNWGVSIQQSDWNTLINVNVSHTVVSDGISIDNSNENIIMDCDISSNADTGIWVLDLSTNNTIRDNRILYNELYGIYISRVGSDDPTNNKIFNNLFNSSGENYGFSASVSVDPNSWNTTYSCGTPNIIGGNCMGGNYWGKVNRKGHSDKCTDSDGDGICNPPGLSLIMNNDDFLPLAEPSNATNCTDITVPGVYYLENNITDWGSGHCFYANVSDVVLDCQGHQVDGVSAPGSYGVYFDGGPGLELSNMYVRNCNFTDWEYAVNYEYSNDGVVSNINVSNATTAIKLNNSDGNVVEDSMLDGSINNSVHIYAGYNNSFSNVNASGSGVRGFYFVYSNQNNITGCRIENNSVQGVFLYSSGNNSIYNNFFNNTDNANYSGTPFMNYWNTTYNCSNGPNIINGSCMGGNYWAEPDGSGHSEMCSDWIDGICDSNLSLWGNNTDFLPLAEPQNATVCMNITSAGIYRLSSDLNSAGTCFTINVSDVSLDCQGYGIEGDDSPSTYGIIVNSSDDSELTNITIKNCNISNWTRGIYFIYVNKSVISKTTIQDNTQYGIRLEYSSSNNLTGITGNENTLAAISLYFSNNSTLTNMTANNNSNYGIYIYNSSNNTMKGVYTLYNTFGIYISSGSDRNTFTGNEFSWNADSGVWISWSSNNTLTGNEILNNTQSGIAMEYAGQYGPNKIYDNLFNNSVNFDFSGVIYPNHWNTTKNCSAEAGPNIIGGECMGGNYWGYPNGTGPSDNCTSQTNGICDYSVNLTSGNEDSLPLTETINQTTCMNITSAGVYSLTNDVNSTGTCFNINVSHVILDCGGHTITGSQNGAGVSVVDVQNITVRNCQISNFSRAVHLESSNKSLFDNLTIYGNKMGSFAGVYSYHSNSSIFADSIFHYNNATDNAGIYLYGSSGNRIENCVFENNTANKSMFIYGGGILGLYSYSSNNTIANTTFINNSVSAYYIYGGGILGLYSYSSNNTFTNTTLFINNVTSVGYIAGGGILGLYADSSSNRFTGTTLISNNATAGSEIKGGGILGLHSYSSNNVFIYTNITSNNATAGSNIQGGGILGMGEYVNNNTFVYTKLSHNNATAGINIQGGGILGIYYYSYNNSLTTTMIVNNNATAGSNIQGGGILGLDYSSNNNSFDTTMIFNNSATAVTDIQGGGILGLYWYSGDNAMKTTVMIKNNATAGTNIVGGGILGLYKNSGKNRFNITILVNNSASGNYIQGGGILGMREFADNNTFANTTLVTNNFVSNTSIAGGGILGMHMSSNGAFSCTSLIDNNATAVTSIYGGGILGLYWDSNNTKFTDIDMSGNTVNTGTYIWGGGSMGIYYLSYNNMFTDTSIFNSKVTAGSSITGGGILGLYDFSSNNTFANTTLISNNITAATSITGGGIIGLYWDSNNNTFINTTLISNNDTAGFYTNNAGTIGLGYGSDSNNFINMSVPDSNRGISLWDSNYTVFSGVNVSGSGGSGFYILDSNHSKITGCRIVDNAVGGIQLSGSRDSSIYNNFLNNTYNSYFTGFNYTNDWNTTKNCSAEAGPNIIGGDCMAGNYWAEPGGTGHSETCADGNGDGICDSYLNLTSGNVDFLPLTENYSSLIIQFVAPTDNNQIVTRNYSYVNLTLSETGSVCILDWNGSNETMAGSGTSFYRNKTLLTNGNYTFSAWCNDTSGNLNQSELRWVYINVTASDITPPDIVIHSPSNTTYRTTSLVFNWTTSESLDWTAYSLNGGPNISISRLKNDTENAYVSDGSWIDPEKAFDENWTTYAYKTGAAATARILYENYTIPSGSIWEANITAYYQLQADCSYINISCRKDDQTWESVRNQSKIDASAHNLTGSANSSCYSGSLLQVRYYMGGACTGGDTRLYETMVTWFGAGNVYYGNISITAQEGSNTIVQYANDSAGNLNSSEIVFFVDSIAPSILNLKNSSTTNQSSFIEFDCDEPCNYSITWSNSSGPVDNILNNTFAFSHNPFLDNLTNSTTYTINLTVWDAIGNYSMNNTFNFTTAPSPPGNETHLAITLLDPSNRTSYNSSYDINFTFNLSNSANISNCTLVLNGVLDQTNQTDIFSNATNTISTALPKGMYMWSINCTDSGGFENGSDMSREMTVYDGIPPISTKFTGTDITYGITDYTNVSGFWLENATYGKIEWLYYVNVSGQDFDSHAFIMNNLMGLESQYVNYNLNSSANLTMLGLPYQFAPVVYRDGAICPSCTMLGYGSGTLSFQVIGFTNYSTGANSNMTIWDQTDPSMPYGGKTKYPYDQVYFYANYTNTTSGGSINGTGVYCNITFNVSPAGPFEMIFNDTTRLYWHNRSFAAAGMYDWNVTCNGSVQGYETLNTTDTVNISPAANTAPDDPSPQINSTDGTNRTTQDLNCFDTITDPDADSMNVTVRWYRNSALNLTAYYNNSYASGTFFNAVLGSGNTSIGDNWSCSLQLFDGGAYSNETNSSYITILSAPGGITGCQLINSPGIYILQDNVTDWSAGDCFVVTVSDAVLDCEGHVVDGVGSYVGFYSYGSGAQELYNVTVKNCAFREWNDAIRYDYTNIGFIISSNISRSDDTGGSNVYLWNSDSNTIDWCDIQSAMRGINFGFDSMYNVIKDTWINGSSRGIEFGSGSILNSVENTLVSESGMYGVSLSANSTKLVNVSVYGSSSRGIYISSSSNVIRNSHVSSSGNYGIYLSSGSQNNTIYDNRLNNTENVGLVSSGQNRWNTTYNCSAGAGPNIMGWGCMGGNYWARPDGRGLSEICIDEDSDGICKFPYNLSSGNVDFLPLTVPSNLTCANITNPGVYRMYENITDWNQGHCLIANVSNVTLDCMGHTIDGPGSSFYGLQSVGGPGSELVNMTIHNCTFTDWYRDIFLSYTDFSQIYDVSADASNWALYLTDSDNNNISRSCIGGILFFYSDYNVFDNSSVNGSNNDGIGFTFAYDNIVRNVSITSSNSDGVQLTSSNRNNITSCRISNSTGYGIRVDSSGNNSIYDNFLNNTNNTGFGGTVYGNYWNTTYNCSAEPNIMGWNCMGGNYWAEPGGTGHSETCGDGNGDGICKDPNYLDALNTDFLPLTEPSNETTCMNITSPGVYELNGSLYSDGTCFNISSSHVAIECHGHPIVGSYTTGSYGILTYGDALTNITVIDCNVSRWETGIYLRNVSQGQITNTTVYNNSGIGIQLQGTSYINITRIFAIENGFNGGIRLDDSQNNNLTNITAVGNDWHGIHISWGSDSNSLTDVYAWYNSGYAVRLTGNSDSNLTHMFATGNQGGVEIINCNGSTVRELIASDSNKYGIYAENSINTTLEYIQSQKNQYGIGLHSSNGTTIRYVNASGSDEHGLNITGSDDNLVEIGQCTSNNQYGIHLATSSNNVFTNMSIMNNTYGGIYLFSAGADGPNLFYDNALNNDNNTLFDPPVYANDWNTTYDCTAGPNIFGGPCIGGNLWEHPGGGGHSETCDDLNGDGICSSPFNMQAGNADYLPLTNPNNITDCAYIKDPGIYYIENDLFSSSTCILINASDVMLDCMGHLIEGTLSSTESGIKAEGTSRLDNITVSNCNTSMWDSGVYFIGVDNSSISGVSSAWNSMSGVRLSDSRNITLTDINASNGNNRGIYSDFCRDITITGAETNGNNNAGIYYWSSPGGMIANANSDGNYDGFHFYNSSGTTMENITAGNNGGSGIYLETSNDSKISNFTARKNYYGFYAISTSNITISNITSGSSYDTGIFIIYSDNISISDVNASNSDNRGISFSQSSNNTVENITASNNLNEGIYFYSSHNNEISSMFLSDNGDVVSGYGMRTNYFDNNTVEKITAINNSEFGVYFSFSQNNDISSLNLSDNNNGMYTNYFHKNTITDLTAMNNDKGFSSGNQNSDNVFSDMRISYSDTAAFSIQGGFNNTIANSTFENNRQDGVELDAMHNTTFRNNTMVNNTVGLIMSSPSGQYKANRIYDNFFNNTKNLEFWGMVHGNYWNVSRDCFGKTNVVGGPCIGGNFWGYPNGTGPSETCSSQTNGICDYPNPLEVNNTDWLPIVLSWASADWDFWNLTNHTTGEALGAGPQFTRSGVLNASAHWILAADITDAMIRHNGTGFSKEYAIPGPYDSNWTNYTMNLSDTDEFRFGGQILVEHIQVQAGFSSNQTSPPISFALWGNASVTEMEMDYGVMLNGTDNYLHCWVNDSQSYAGLSGYNVSFYRDGGYLGSSLTGGDGEASFLYSDDTDGAADYTMGCNITDQPGMYYNASAQNEESVSLGVIPMTLEASVSESVVGIGGPIDLHANITTDEQNIVDSVWANISYYNFSETLTDTVYLDFAGAEDAGGYRYHNYTYYGWSPPRSGNYSVLMYANLSLDGRTVQNSTGFDVMFGNVTVHFVNQNYRILTNQTFNYTVNISALEGDLFDINVTLNSTEGWVMEVTDASPQKNIGYVLNGTTQSLEWEVSSNSSGLTRIEAVAEPLNGTNLTSEMSHEVIAPMTFPEPGNASQGSGFLFSVYVAGNVSDIGEVYISLEKEYSGSAEDVTMGLNDTVNESICFGTTGSGNVASMSQGSYADCSGGSDCNLSINGNSDDYWGGVGGAGEQWLEVIFNQSWTVNAMNFLWKRESGFGNPNISVYYKATDAGAWVNVLGNLSAPTSKGWENISEFTPFKAKRMKINFSDSGWLKVYEFQAITPGGVEGSCYIYTGYYNNTYQSGNHSIASSVITPTGNASGGSYFQVDYGTPTIQILFPPSLINGTTNPYTGARIRASGGDIRNVSVNLSIENATIVSDGPDPSPIPYLSCYDCGGPMETPDMKDLDWTLGAESLGITNLTVNASSTTGKGGNQTESREIEVILEDPYPPEITGFRFQYGCSGEQSPISMANLYYDACAWATVVENLTGVKEANLSVTFPDNGTYKEIGMTKYSESGNTSWWIMSFADGAPLNMTGEYNVSFITFDYGGNNATSNSSKSMNNTLNVTDTYSINFTNNHTVYSRGENLTFEALDVNNYSVAALNWTVNVTMNVTQNLTNSTDNPFSYNIGKGMEGAFSIELDVSGNNNTGSLRWDFDVSGSIYPYFVSPSSGAQYTPSTVIYSEARVMNERGEVLDYYCTLNLTCPYTNLLMGGGPPGSYLDTSGNCTAHSSYGKNFNLYLDALDPYNNSGIGQVSLKTSAKETGDDGGPTGGGMTGGTIAPPPVCNCTNWVSVSCGSGGCLDTQMYQTRSCFPVNCSSESRCIDYMECRLEGFDFSLVDRATIVQGESHQTKIYVNNTGKIPVELNISAASECAEIVTSEASVQLSAASSRDIFMTVHVPLGQSPGECPVNVDVSSAANKKTKGLTVTITENSLVSELRTLQGKMGDIEGYILDLSSSGVDVSGLTGLKEGAAQAMENAEQSIERDDVESLRTNVANMANFIAEIEASMQLMLAYKFMFDNKWSLMTIALISILITYLATQVLLPSSRLGREIAALTRKEKELVQTRVSTEKQYFKRQIDESTFNKILVKKQEEILRTRGLLTTKRKERSMLIATGLSPSAMLRWVVAGPRRLAGRLRRKKKETAQPAARPAQPAPQSPPAEQRAE